MFLALGYIDFTISNIVQIYHKLCKCIHLNIPSNFILFIRFSGCILNIRRKYVSLILYVALVVMFFLFEDALMNMCLN